MKYPVFLKDILVIFFILIGFYLVYRLFNCRKNSWPRKHRGLYGFIALGILQMPLFVVPIGYFSDCKLLWAWIALYAASFGIFAPLYRKWCRICQGKSEVVSVETKSGEKSFAACCPICGDSSKITVSDDATEVGCPVCGNPIERKYWVKISPDYVDTRFGGKKVVKCCNCDTEILWDGTSKEEYCPSCGQVVTLPN